jgi:hypothetical protein
MPRPKDTYGRSDETYEALKCHVGPISKEYPCEDKFIYAIKNGDSKDPYQPFRHLFLSAARAGAPVEIWLRDLHSIVERAGSTSDNSVDDLVEQLSIKIRAEADSTSVILDSIGDRQLDRRECHAILHAVEIGKDINSGIESIVLRRLAQLDESSNVQNMRSQ